MLVSKCKVHSRVGTVRGVGRDNRGPARDIATSFVIKFQRATR